MTELHSALVSGAEVARLLNLPRPRVADALRAANVQPAVGHANSAKYPLGVALQAVMADLSRGDPSDPARMRPAARNAHYAAALKREKLRVMLGEFVPREAVRTMTAKVFAAFVQQCRGIRDALERRHGVTPQIAAVVDECIDEALDQLAQGFKKAYEEAAARERELADSALAAACGQSPEIQTEMPSASSQSEQRKSTTPQSAKRKSTTPRDSADISDLI